MSYLCVDIEKAYLQIAVSPTDSFYGDVMEVLWCNLFVLLNSVAKMHAEN